MQTFLALIVKALLEVIKDALIELLSRPKFEVKDAPTPLKETLDPPSLPDVVAKYNIVFDENHNR